MPLNETELKEAKTLRGDLFPTAKEIINKTGSTPNGTKELISKNPEK